MPAESLQLLPGECWSRTLQRAQCEGTVPDTSPATCGAVAAPCATVPRQSLPQLHTNTAAAFLGSQDSLFLWAYNTVVVDGSMLSVVMTRFLLRCWF